jgi:predicted transposase/invertase (TIGR01784 family)
MLRVKYDPKEEMEALREEAWEYGHEEGLEEGREEGREESMMTVARNALAQGASIEFVQKITGLDLETVKSLAIR